MDQFFGAQPKINPPRKERTYLLTRLSHFGAAVVGLSILPYLIGFAYKEPNTFKFLFHEESGIFGANGTLAKSWKSVSRFVLNTFIKVVPGTSIKYRSLDTTTLV